MGYALLYFSIFILSFATTFAEIITGFVADKETGKPIISASVSIVGTSKGTYANRDGAFKLPGIAIGQELKFSAIGYKSKNVTIKNDDELLVQLEPQSVSMSEALVTDDIKVEEIIRRAIANKAENQSKIKTVEQTLFSKVKVTLGGEAYELRNPMPGSESRELERDLWENIIAETYSKSYKDYQKDISHDVILKRRNTANFEQKYNLFSLSSFVNFYANNVRINNTTFTSPLSEDALDEYSYSLVSKDYYDGKFIYIIDYESISSVYPGFVGRLSILEDTYELTYIKAKPTEDDLIEFISNIEFEEKFEKVDSLYWYPTLLNTSGTLKIEILTGMLSITAEANAMTVVEDITINQPLPDSVYSEQTSRVTAAENADSTEQEFWEQTSLIKTTNKEREIYQKTDSLALEKAMKDSIQEGSLNFDYLPYLRLNRVDGYTAGATADLQISRYFLPDFFAAYAFSSKNFYFGANLESRWFNFMKSTISFERNTFTQSINNDRSHILSSITTLFGEDYHDWYLSDRVSGALWFNLSNLSAKIEYSNNLITNISTKNPKVISSDGWRPNPTTIEDRYEQLQLTAEYESNTDVSSSEIEYNAKLIVASGRAIHSEIDYTHIYGSVGGKLPVFKTGFEPANLSLALNLGTTDNSPAHLLYRMNSNIVVFGIHNSFLSPNYYIFGGSEFGEIHASIDFSDFLWRVAGLPKYRSRGLGLQLCYSGGYYKQDEHLRYVGSNDKLYQEVGFNITKIPTFISPLFQLELGFRWGVGQLGNGNFGFGLNISSPIIE